MVEEVDGAFESLLTCKRIFDEDGRVNVQGLVCAEIKHDVN
jgi:hypothetical protein